MKTKAEKYQDAIARNITNLKGLEFDSIEKARHHVGIRKGDDAYDATLAKLVTKPKQKKVEVTHDH